MKLTWKNDPSITMDLADWNRFKRDVLFAAKEAGIPVADKGDSIMVDGGKPGYTYYFHRGREIGPEFPLAVLRGKGVDEKSAFMVAAALLLAHHDRKGSHLVDCDPGSGDRSRIQDVRLLFADAWNRAKTAWQYGAKKQNGFNPQWLKARFAAWLSEHIDASAGKGEAGEIQDDGPEEVYIEAEYAGYYTRRDGTSWAIARIFGQEHHLCRAGEFGTTYGGPQGCFGHPCISESGHFHGVIFVKGVYANGGVYIDGERLGNLVDGCVFRHGQSTNRPRVVSGDQAFCEVIANDPRATTSLTIHSTGVDVRAMLRNKLPSSEFLALMDVLEEKASEAAEDMAFTGAEKIGEHYEFLQECEENGVRP